MSSRIAVGLAAGALVAGVLLAGAGVAAAQSCARPTPLVTMCRYVISTPEALVAEAVGRVRRDGPSPHADVVLRIDGRVCGSGADGGLGHRVARARCVLKPQLTRGAAPGHVAVAEFSGLSDAEPVSLEISLTHRGGLLSLPLEEKALAPEPAHRKWFSLFGR